MVARRRRRFARRDGAFSADGASRRFVARPAPDVVSRGVAVSVRVLRRRVRVAPVRRRRGGRRARHGLVPRGPRVREASGGGFRASGRRRRRARRRRRLPVLGRGRGDAAERNGDALSKAERRARRRGWGERQHPARRGDVVSRSAYVCS